MKALLFLLVLAASAPALSNPAVERAMQSVVVIEVHTPRGRMLCAGVVYAPNRILTAGHCAEGATRIFVRFHDTSSVVATVVGASKPDEVAVLAVHTTPCKPLAVGRSASLRPGDPLFLIGHTFGMFEWSVISGVVSKLRAPYTYDGGFGSSAEFILHDMEARSGHSGGPVINQQGELVGIHTASHTYGVGFAVSIDHALRVARSFQ